MITLRKDSRNRMIGLTGNVVHQRRRVVFGANRTQTDASSRDSKVHFTRDSLRF